MDKLPLSVLLLARDEAGRIESLLSSLAFARETVVVTDPAGGAETREIAERAGARVFERPFDGFGPQRRFALAQCSEPWVLWIDADETLEGQAPARIAAQMNSPGAENGWRLRRRTWFLGRPIRFCGWQGERVLRLFRREAAAFDDAPVHERVRVAGAIGDLDVTLEHRSYETWDDCRAKMIRYARAGAERMRREGRGASLSDLVVRPPLRFVRMYVLQLGFLDGARGWVVCALAAAQVFLKYAERWADARRG